jgi:hypothetical protein
VPVVVAALTALAVPVEAAVEIVVAAAVDSHRESQYWATLLAR